jgi:WD40 repeat protein
MKLWSVKGQPECLGTIREHAGPVFTLTQGEGYVFSGGMEGIIRAWDFNNANDKKDISRKCCVGSWNITKDDKVDEL